MPAYNSDSSNPSSPLRTPPIFGADYEEDAAQLIYQLGPRNDHELTTELVPKVPAQMSTLENTQKCRMKVSSDYFSGATNRNFGDSKSNRTEERSIK
ncbi:hypothetical protein AYI70_g7740 [Smittium culicis]|uniref:Uncharacterized protein n=1 Tax=Smittium culicis TaxID=133412 RepID=A0A1R1XJ65_9FUNG|nr:hypothetical protein AYI70_g7740 [Smittium culicis]